MFLLSLIALMITPYGTRLAVYPFDMAFSQPLNVANIQEWQSMPFNLPGGKLFLALVLAVVIAQVTLRPKWRPDEFALFLIGTAMACLHLRFILVFVPFCAPILNSAHAAIQSKTSNPPPSRTPTATSRTPFRAWLSADRRYLT